MSTFYAEDLAYVHHTGFGAFSERAAPELLSLFRRCGIQSGRVVDLGCGSGLWAHALLEAGFEVLGVDCAPAMIELARTVAPAGELRVSSLYTVDLPACVAVTALGEGLTYFAPEDPREALPPFFCRVFEALVPGGLLVFDVITRGEHGPTRYQTSLSGEDWRVEAEVVEEPEISLLTRHITTTRILDGRERVSQEVHRVRTFSASEIEEWLRGCGFTVERLPGYGSVQLPPQRLGFLACKPGPAQGQV